MLRQRECFPKLDLVAAKAAMDHLEAPVCVYFLGTQMVGQLFLYEVEDDFIKINFVFAYPAVQCVETEALLRTVEVSNPFDRYRRFFLCAACSKRRRDLYFVQSWACAECHRLLNRSQLVDKEVKLWEERDALHARLKAGRPKAMHNATYFVQRQRLMELERRLHGRPRKEASNEHNAVVTEQWLPGREIDFWSSRYTITRGNFVRLDH